MVTVSLPVAMAAIEEMDLVMFRVLVPFWEEPVEMARPSPSRAEAEFSKEMKLGAMMLALRKAKMKEPAKILRRSRVCFGLWIRKPLLRLDFLAWRRRKRATKRTERAQIAPPMAKGVAEFESVEVKKPVSGVVLVVEELEEGVVLGIEFGSAP